MNSVRSLMGDVSFHGMATPPRCAMLREAVTHVAGLRCYPCRRTVPLTRLTRGLSRRAHASLIRANPGGRPQLNRLPLGGVVVRAAPSSDRPRILAMRR